MLPEIPAEQLRAAVDGVARAVLAEVQIGAPPIDAFLIAERLGIAVAREGAGTVRARFVRLGGDSHASQAAILVADDPRPERQQWAVAHEIGECHAYRVFAELGLSSRDAAGDGREVVANQLASALLLPRRWFEPAGRARDWDLLALKAQFAAASHELVARRMLEMPPAIIVTVFDQGRPLWRRGNLGSAAPRLSPPERAAQQTAHETNQPARCDRDELPAGVEDVRAWPIHEPDWRREIVRTAVEASW